MRNPELLVESNDTYKNNGKSTITLNNLDYYSEPQYDLIDPKDFKKYLRDIESAVRTSFEYRRFIQWLKNVKGMNECSFLTNVSSMGNSKIKIELHHEPFTLYDICYIVFKKRQALREDTRVPAVAEEVMYLHYLGWVGFTPVSQTIHELIHNCYLFVPSDTVRGAYRLFTNAYYNYIDPEVLDDLDAIELATKEGSYMKQMNILNRHDIYVNIGGSIELPKRDYITSMIKTRIYDLKNNTKTMCVLL